MKRSWIKNTIKFFWEDFWDWSNGMPKCSKGGYCNSDVSEYYSRDIKAGSRSMFVYGNKYYCSKCGRDILFYQTFGNNKGQETKINYKIKK